jgi:hypothetical protein
MAEAVAVDVSLGVMQVIRTLGYLSATNTANLSIVSRDPAGYDKTHLMVFRRAGAGEAKLRHIGIIDGKAGVVREEDEEGGDFPKLASYLADFIRASATSGELAEVQLRLNYKTESLAPAAHITWGIGEGRIELGRAF